MSTAERRAREKAQRRRGILNAARQEFFERGFHSPTVDDVARRAEVSKGTIYLYYESKEVILAAGMVKACPLLERQGSGKTAFLIPVPCLYISGSIVSAGCPTSSR